MSKRAVGVLSACILTVFTAYTIRYSYGTLLPEMIPSLGITNAQAGAIYSAYFISYTIFSPIAGMLSDRYDTRILLLIFVAIMGAGTFLMRSPDSILQASAFLAIAGIGASACWAPIMAVSQRWASVKRRGLTLAIVDTGSTLGVMAAGSLVPLAVTFSDWHFAWMCLGIMGLALALVDFAFIRSYPSSPSGRDTTKTPVGRIPARLAYKALLSDKRFWFIGFAYLLTGFTVMIPFTFISTYAAKELAFPYASATLLVTFIGAGGLVGKLILGHLSDRLGRIKIMITCAVLISGGCLAIAFNRGLALIAFTFLFGFGYGACWSMYAACASDFFSRQNIGGIIGLWTFYLGIGLLVSPVVGGWLADITGTLRWSFVCAGAAGLTSILLLLPMLKTARMGLAETISQ